MFVKKKNTKSNTVAEIGIQGSGEEFTKDVSFCGGLALDRGGIISQRQRMSYSVKLVLTIYFPFRKQS